VTHNTLFAESLAARAVFFERGKIVGEGTPRELLDCFNWSLPGPSRGQPPPAAGSSGQSRL